MPTAVPYRGKCLLRHTLKSLNAQAAQLVNQLYKYLPEPNKNSGPAGVKRMQAIERSAYILRLQASTFGTSYAFKSLHDRQTFVNLVSIIAYIQRGAKSGERGARRNQYAFDAALDIEFAGNGVRAVARQLQKVC